MLLWWNCDFYSIRDVREPKSTFGSWNVRTESSTFLFWRTHFCPCAPCVIIPFHWQHINRRGSERLLPKVSYSLPLALWLWFKSHRHSACLLLWKSGLLMCVAGPLLYCISTGFHCRCVNTSPMGALIRARVHSRATPESFAAGSSW